MNKYDIAELLKAHAEKILLGDEEQSGINLMNLTMVKCPYCGTHSEILVEKEWDKQIAICNPYEGGCDNYFTVFSQIEIKTKAFKIEGQETEALK